MAAGAVLVFAAGGDGTVRACAQALAGTGIPLAIVPLGTANLTARALGIPGRADRAIEAGFRGRDRVIDLACAELGDADPAEPGGQLAEPGTWAGGAGGAGGIGFAAMAGIGLDAAVVEAAHAPVKRRLGWVAYAVSGVAAFVPARGSSRCAWTGGRRCVRRARCVVVGNAGLLPGGFVLLPGARLDDGRLDVGILAPAGVFGWPRAAARVLTRSRGQNRTLERFQARRVEIAPRRTCPGRSTARS